MRRAILILVLLAFGAPLVHAAIATTLAAQAYASGTSTTFSSGTGIGGATYNQAAGHSIVAFVGCYSCSSATITATDTASNSYLTAIAMYSGSNNFYYMAFYVKNTLASSTNAITATASTGSPYYWSIIYYDVSGTNTTAPLDVAVSATTSTTTSISKTITTAYANESVMSAAFCSNGTWSAATQPSGFTKGSSNLQSWGAYKNESAILTGSAITWTALSPSTNSDMEIVSLAAATTTTKAPALRIK